MRNYFNTEHYEALNVSLALLMEDKSLRLKFGHLKSLHHGDAATTSDFAALAGCIYIQKLLFLDVSALYTMMKKS